MMDIALTSWMLFRGAERHYGDVEIVTQTGPATQHRYRYHDFAQRTRKLVTVLEELGVSDHARIGTLAWNSYQHLECYFAIPHSGRVLHTLNARLSKEDLVYIINDAKDEAIFVAPDLLPLLESISKELTTVTTVITFGTPPPSSIIERLLDYEALLTGAVPFEGEVEIDERQPLGICYTSGTTGRPKGVESTHRSTVLHTMAATSGNGPGLSCGDAILPIVPMFHVNAWGLPFGAVSAGSKIVFSTPTFDPAIVISLINQERVTKAAGVPTVWLAVLDELERTGNTLPYLKELLCGGSQPPKAMIERYLTTHGVALLQAWGMTEASPIATTSRVPHHLLDAPTSERAGYMAKAGIPVAGVELCLRSDDNSELAFDGKATGEILLRGPWIIETYLGGAGQESFTHDGWFRTGDVGCVSTDGTLTITDRTKDLIKSGGEWISSVTLEGILMGHPAVAEAAVIAIPDAKWVERPLAAVVTKPGATITLADIHAFLLENAIPSWQLPDRLELIDEIPRTSVGKFDKKVLRARYPA
ncbi:MAG: long-chain-fatty-acid--CoA ligase [Ferrimicrobium sp.]